MRVHSTLRLALLSLWFCSCGSDKVVLQFNTKDPKPEAYQLESQAKWIIQAESSTPQAMGTALSAHVLSTKIISYSDSSVRLQFVADSVTYHSDQQSPEECKHIEQSMNQQDFQLKMSMSGAVQDVRVPESSQDLGQTVMELGRMLVKLQPMLPGMPVSLGDTWESQLAYGDDAGQSGVMYKWFQVEDLFTHGGKTLAKLRVNIKYHLDQSTSAHFKVSSDPFVLGTGDLVFNVTDGQIEDANMEINGALQTLQVRQQIHLKRLPAVEQIVVGEKM